MQTFTLPVNQEMADYLQRLGMEVEARSSVIDFMFESHKNDKDTSMFESIPFKHYHHEFEEKMMEYNLAKKQFGDQIKPIVAEKVGVPVDELIFDWNISDFSSLQVNITVK